MLATTTALQEVALSRQAGLPSWSLEPPLNSRPDGRQGAMRLLDERKTSGLDARTAAAITYEACADASPDPQELLGRSELPAAITLLARGVRRISRAHLALGASFGLASEAALAMSLGCLAVAAVFLRTAVGALLTRTCFVLGAAAE